MISNRILDRLSFVINYNQETKEWNTIKNRYGSEKSLSEDLIDFFLSYSGDTKEVGIICSGDSILLSANELLDLNRIAWEKEISLFSVLAEMFEFKVSFRIPETKDEIFQSGEQKNTLEQ